MKVLLEINEKYKEQEIHLCSAKKTQELLALKDNLEKLLQPRLSAYQDQRVVMVGITQIVRIFAENKKVYLRTSTDTLQVKERMYTLQAQLQDQGFVRISNSEIVNMEWIDKLDMGYTGTIRISMNNGDTTYVSRRYISKLKEALK